jgi:GNAT superfamily N-acetyltransferase
LSKSPAEGDVVSRKIVRLTLDNLSDLPVACQGCVFWELDPVARDRAMAAGEPASEKESWVSHVLLEWGSCGRVAYVDGEPAGYVLYAPPAYFPATASFPTAPVSEDAVLLATARVDPEQRGYGVGRQLLQAVAKDLVKRGGIRAVEAFGVSGPSALRNPCQSCVLPVDFLLRTGFKTHRAHLVHPRLRLELKSVLTWREEVEVALEKLVGAVVPRPAPRPVHPHRTPRSDGGA